MDVYNVLISKSDDGKVKIDYENRNVYYHKKLIIENGYIISDKIGDIDISNMKLIDNPISEIEELRDYYIRFIHSVPHTERKSYMFKPLSADELSNEDIMRHDNRERCYAEFILIMLFSVIAGSLVWDKKGWFYKIPETTCIIYKKYLED